MTADLADLRDHLTEYLDRVRRGETVLITDHQKVIAKLQPAVQGEIQEDDRAWVDDLVRRGIAVAPEEPMTSDENEELLAEVMSAPPLPDLVAAVLTEREEGW